MNTDTPLAKTIAAYATDPAWDSVVVETTRLEAIRLSTEWAEGFTDSKKRFIEGFKEDNHPLGKGIDNLIAASTELLTAFKNIAGSEVAEYPNDAMTDLVVMMDALHALSHDGALPDEVWVDSPTGAYDLYAANLSAIDSLFEEMTTVTPVGAYSAA